MFVLLMLTALFPCGGFSGPGASPQHQHQAVSADFVFEQDPADHNTLSISSLWPRSASLQKGHSHTRHDERHAVTPYFQEPRQNASTVTAQLGSTAYLTCRVNRLGDKTVSWVRRESDAIKLLTWGLQTYSNDDRYLLDFESPKNWKLQIKNMQRQDAGTYECQVSTHPPLVLFMFLNVVAPVVDILDERSASVGEKLYKTGNTIELKCQISQMPQAQTFVLWRHGDHMLNYDTSRGGIRVKTDTSSSVIVSTLFIANATWMDTGNYTCSLGDVATGSVLVHILNGERPQAMHGSSTLDRCSLPAVLMLSTLPWMLGFLR